MNRGDFQALSRLRLREAKILLDARSFSGAFYLSGYSVECAIKSAIAKKVARHDFPNKKMATDSHSHLLLDLMKTAEIFRDLEQDMRTNPALAANWQIVKDWKVESRYETLIPELVARDMYAACAARSAGVLKWLKGYW